MRDELVLIPLHLCRASSAIVQVMKRAAAARGDGLLSVSESIACLMPSITHAVGNLSASVESWAGPGTPPRAGNVKKISSETRSLHALLESLLPHAINCSISAVSLPQFPVLPALFAFVSCVEYLRSPICLPQLAQRRRSPTWRACWALVRAPAIVISLPWTCIDSPRLRRYL